jgi:hypothetical protein
VTPSNEQIEKGARAVPVDYFDHENDVIVRHSEWDVVEAVLSAVLSPIEQEIQRLRDDAWIDFRCALPGDVQTVANAEARLDAYSRCIAIVLGVSDE